MYGGYALLTFGRDLPLITPTVNVFLSSFNMFRISSLISALTSYTLEGVT